MIRKKRKQNPETPIVRLAFSMLQRDYGGLHWKVNSGSRNNAKFVGVEGHPDIAGYDCTGRAIFAEVKTHDGELTEKQWFFLRKAQDTHAIALVVIGSEDGKTAAVYLPSTLPGRYIPKKYRQRAA